MTDRTRVTLTAAILALAWVIASLISQLPTMISAFSTYNAAQAVPEPTATPGNDPNDPFGSIGRKPDPAAVYNWQRERDPATRNLRLTAPVITLAQHLTIAVAIVSAQQTRHGGADRRVVAHELPSLRARLGVSSKDATPFVVREPRSVRFSTRDVARSARDRGFLSR
jgi:hypothetical protein